MIIIYTLILLLNIEILVYGCAYIPRILESEEFLENFNERAQDLKYSYSVDDVDGFFVRIKYKPTVLLQKNVILETPVSSVCFKCGVCLVVSEKLDQILSFAQTTSVSLKEFNDDMSANLLRPVCDFSFTR